MGLSKGTQELLDDMMKQSGLTKHQQRRLKSEMSEKGALPLRCNPTDSQHDGVALKKQARNKLVKVPRPIGKREPPAPPTQQKTGLKMRTQIVSEGLYKQEPFKPTTSEVDYAKEKRKLQYYMMLDGDDALVNQVLNHKVKGATRTKTKMEPTDITNQERFEEIVQEIDDRRQFLDDIAACKGDLKTHGPKIRAEISQLVREMEQLDAAMSTNS